MDKGIEALKPGKYAILYRDNWDGEGDTYHTLANLESDGRWLSDETGKELHEYEGDEILKAWPLDDGADVLQSAPNGLMQPSNELAEMKRKCAELKASHHDLRESMAAIHNTIRGNGAYVSLLVLLTASENAWSKSASAAAITVECNDVITCWSCKKSMTLLERSSADGFCPHCDAEIDMQDGRAAGGTVEGSE